MSKSESRTSHSSRLTWLDVVRGLAAIIVYLQHTLERDSAAYSEWSWHWVNFGRVGVTAFFLVSGFVIPFSLERANSLKKFWVSRFFRLYPLYWTAMAGAVVCAMLGYVLVEPGFNWRSPQHLAVNATMIQQLVRIPNALPVFWTLGLEMLFYWIISIAFALKFNEKSLHILYGIGLAVMAAGLVAMAVLNRPFPGIGAMFLVITACFGTVFYRYTDGKITLRQLLQAGTFVAVVLGVLVGIAFRFSKGEVGDVNEAIGPMSRIGSALVGYALFFAVYMLRSVRFPRILTHLGLVSYSVYLMHPFVWYFSPKLAWPVATMAVGFVATVLLATLTYYWIEAPCQRLGRNWPLKRRVEENREPQDSDQSKPQAQTPD